MRRRTRHLGDARSSRTAPQFGLRLGPEAELKWTRILAVVCVLLITLGACVQACHVHDDGGPAAWKTTQSSRHNGPADAPGGTPTSPPDHCLLCVAMHAAMPSAQGVAPVPIQQIQRAIFIALLPRRMQRVSFDMFSRPPPPTRAQAHATGTTGKLFAF